MRVSGPCFIFLLAQLVFHSQNLDLQLCGIVRDFLLEF